MRGNNSGLTDGRTLRRVSSGVVAGLALAVTGGQANAALISACGPNVCYEYESTQTAITLTGTPTLVGDSMVFLPGAFSASGAGGTSQTTTANFIFSRVWTVDSNNEITLLTAHEEFDYSIIVDGEVRAALYLQARSLNYVLDGTSTVQNFIYGDDISEGPTGGLVIATLDAAVGPAAAFALTANNMQVGIQNTLIASTTASPAGQQAFIQKKFTLVTETLNPVPVPAAVWLFGSGLGVLAWLRRRAKA